MSLGEWIGKRVHNWTAKPFPEGLPALSAKNGNAASSPPVSNAALNSANLPSTTFSPANATSFMNTASSPSAVETPKESAEEIAEKIMILIPYIKQYRSQGMLDEEIVAFLIEHSWPEYIVKKAIKSA